MKVTKCETMVVSPPIRHPGYLGVGALETVDNVIVRLETDSGHIGVGEASPWPVFAENAWSIKAAIDHYLGPAVIGEDPLSPERVLQKLDRVLHEYGFAKAAIEMALIDLAGKALGVPAYVLLGGVVRDRISLSYSIANQDIARDVEEIQWLRGQGLRVFKIKTGVLTLRQELKRLEAIREALDESCDLRIDFNQGLTREHAIGFCRALERFAPTFIEQPIRGWDLDGMAMIAAAIDTPIMADESVFSVEQAFMLASRKAADIVSIKLMKSGGLLRSKRIAAICEAAGIPNYAGCMWESGIGIAASLHLTASTPNVRYGSDYYIPGYLMTDDLIVEPLRVENGDILVPHRPGLGIEPDWAAIERYRVHG